MEKSDSYPCHNRDRDSFGFVSQRKRVIRIHATTETGIVLGLSLKQKRATHIHVTTETEIVLGLSLKGKE